MAMPERSILVGVFSERGEADRAIEELQGAGFSNEQIRFEQQEAMPHRIAMPGGTVGGGAAGFGTTAGTPAPIITSNEPTREGGLIGRIKRLFEGRTDARIVDDLVAMGVPEEEARYYQSEFELGHTIVTVDAGDRREDALATLRENGAYDITTPRGTSDPNAQAGTTTPNAPRGTSDPNAQARTTTSNAPQASDDSMVRPETYDTQPRQSDT
ncbi:MAG: hypothetical protein E6I91_10165 [Chloroflexi bacterium]|nr:MAG: hypothetical protein E6I91_10165 [Chloroflexota bacterium]